MPKAPRSGGRVRRSPPAAARLRFRKRPEVLRTAPGAFPDSPSPCGARRRRYQLGADSNLYTVIGDDSVEITNETTLQDHPGEAETPWVESGYHQGDAGPRPFMEEALRDFVHSSEAEAIVVSALLAAGFEIEAD